MWSLALIVVITGVVKLFMIADIGLSGRYENKDLAWHNTDAFYWILLIIMIITSWYLISLG